jgi:phosphoribosylformylglycinamidine cyclo-ligase
MGSNGLTSARHDVFSGEYKEKYPESYDDLLSKDLAYTGQLKLTDSVENMPIDAGKMVLSPTRTYAPIIKAILEQHRSEIHGLVHCSGGGQTKILHFVKTPLHIIKDNLFKLPILFKTIQAQSGTDWREMYQVFNMGHRMEIYVKPELAESIIKISESFGVPAKVVGRVEASEKPQLSIRSAFGEFTY